MQMPVRVGNLNTGQLSSSQSYQGTHRVRTQFRILVLKLPRLRARDINNPIDNNMRNVDTLWPELPRERLRQRAQGKLGRCENREVSRALETGRCTGEDQGRGIIESGRFEEKWEHTLGEVEGSQPSEYQH